MQAVLPSEVAGSSEPATLTRRNDGYTEKGCAAEEYSRRMTGGSGKSAVGTQCCNARKPFEGGIALRRKRCAAPPRLCLQSKHPPRSARARGSSGGGLGSEQFPVPGQKFVQPGSRRSAIRASTSASQACGSVSLSLAVAIRVYMAAARSPPRSEPANNHDRHPTAIPQGALGGIVGQTDAPVVGKTGEGRPAPEHVGDRFAGLAMVRQSATFGPDPPFEIGNDRPAFLRPSRQMVTGRHAVNRALDGEERVDAAYRLDGEFSKRGAH
jgi:hypothetical protein